MKVENFWDFKDKWFGEYSTIFLEIFIGAASGLSGDNAKGFTDSQLLLLFVAIIFNTVILTNILLAVVGAQQGDVAGLAKPHYYRQLVNQLCMLQRLRFNPPDRPEKQFLFCAYLRSKMKGN